MADKGIDVLLEEQRSFPPPQLKKLAHVRSAQVFARAKKDPRGFWAAAARELE